jgi:ubiquinone/menaquinone biosynthesis C-methylase UbiE
MHNPGQLYLPRQPRSNSSDFLPPTAKAIIISGLARIAADNRQPSISMLTRVLEPEVMDSVDEAVDYDAMDHSQVNRVFAEDFWASFGSRVVIDLGADREILDVGTGTALIPIELCRSHPQCRVLGVDLAENMLIVARKNIARSRLEANIRVERIDAKRLPYEDGQFAAVISNSIVHHIPQPLRVLAECWRVLQPGGGLFIRDLLRPADDDEVRRLVATYAAGANAHQQQMFDDSLRAALSLKEIQDLVRQVGANPQDVRQTTDRHWTWAGVKV